MLEEKRLRRRGLRFSIATQSIMSGLDAYSGAVVSSKPRLFSHTKLAHFLTGLLNSDASDDAVKMVFYSMSLAPLFDAPSPRRHIRAQIEYALMPRFEGRYDINFLNFMQAVDETQDRLAIFNPFAWQRREPGIEEAAIGRWT